ncbi:hypothetical protein EYR40_007185 [Pleurotus pulmonarius]|nr:hypothetical protein EYR38_002254 [Pleurotus pulmonarius]KAF4588650.1 hypothetical protein EYR40_010203 [Pleurotus pulmonarius]KAF4600079.1 hypothetical protein EYR40_007185 [Pleurotus pulmonarius]
MGIATRTIERVHELRRQLDWGPGALVHTGLLLIAISDSFQSVNRLLPPRARPLSEVARKQQRHRTRESKCRIAISRLSTYRTQMRSSLRLYRQSGHQQGIRLILYSPELTTIIGYDSGPSLPRRSLHSHDDPFPRSPQHPNKQSFESTILSTPATDFISKLPTPHREFANSPFLELHSKKTRRQYGSQPCLCTSVQSRVRDFDAVPCEAVFETPHPPQQDFVQRLADTEDHIHAFK